MAGIGLSSHLTPALPAWCIARVCAAAAVSFPGARRLPVAATAASPTASRTAPSALVFQSVAPRAAAPRSVASRGQDLHIRACLFW